MYLEEISGVCCARTLHLRDAQSVFSLYLTNPSYFAFMHDAPCLESARYDLCALPPGKNEKDKLFLGFYEGDDLVAVMDLILAYPDRHTAYIGLFMVHGSWQGKGIGSRIVQKVLEQLKVKGFLVCRLGCIEANLGSIAFWKKNGFAATGEKVCRDSFNILLMEKAI